MKVLLVRPRHDDVTETSHAWGGAFRRDLPAKAGRVEVDLAGEKATKALLKSSLVAHPDTAVVAYYGHGKPGSFHADGAEIVGASGSKITPGELVASARKVYAVACFAGQTLGKALGKAGSEFVGYKAIFTTSPPADDAFGELVNGCLKHWIENPGLKSSEIRDLLDARWGELIQDYQTGDMSGSPFAVFVVLAARINRDALCSH